MPLFEVSHAAFLENEYVILFESEMCSCSYIKPLKMDISFQVQRRRIRLPRTDG